MEIKGILATLPKKYIALVDEKKEYYKIPQAKLRSRIAPVKASQVIAVSLSMS